MGRLRRDEPTTVPLHLTARGVRRLELFADDQDFETYTELLATAARRNSWTVLGFCLLPNHLHLVIRLAEPTLSRGMHWLQSAHARRFNIRHEHQGHAFDARFFSRPIESEEHLFRVLRYVPMNPVVAGLCADPGDWRWSSFASIAGERDDFPFVAVRRVRLLYGRTQAAGASGFAEAVRSSIPAELVV